jgi:hypothetical protein
MLAVAYQHTEVDSRARQWEYILSSFAPDALYCRGGRGTGFVLSEAIAIGSASDLPEDPLVVFAPQEGRYVRGVISLVDFEHPVSATYYFGSDSTHMNPEEFGGRVPDFLVYIPVDTQDELYSFAAYAIAAWDRRMKAV